MNKYLKTGLIWAFILALILIPTYCGLNQFRARKTVKNNNFEQYKSEDKDNFILNEVAKDKRLLQKKYDSLLVIKQKVIKGRDRIKDSLIYISDSTCKISLNILYTECLKNDQVNDSLLKNKSLQAQKDSISIATLTHKVGTKQERINRDSTYIEHLHKDSIPQVKRKALWKGRGQGASAYAIIRESINAASKFKP